MIGRKAHPRHPDDASRCVFVPLTYDPHSGECVPIMGPASSYTSELLAARVCLGNWLEQYWSEIRKLVRHTRAFCDHPNFARFEADGIDAEMIKASARQLADVVELGSPNIIQLFDAPTDDDNIRIGDVVHELDGETRFLVPVRPIESDAEALSPDTLLARYVRMAVRKVSDLLRQPISRRGLEQAIDLLILMLPPDDDEPESTEREPSQFLADHRAARHLVTAIKKSEERTGRQVSVRGMEAMIGVLERLIAIHESENQAGGEAMTDDPGPELDGVVLREIDDAAPADEPNAGDGPGSVAPTGTLDSRKGNGKPGSNGPGDNGPPSNGGEGENH